MMRSISTETVAAHTIQSLNIFCLWGQLDTIDALYLSAHTPQGHISYRTKVFDIF